MRQCSGMSPERATSGQEGIRWLPVAHTDSRGELPSITIPGAAQAAETKVDGSYGCSPSGGASGAESGPLDVTTWLEVTTWLAPQLDPEEGSPSGQRGSACAAA